MEQKSSTKKIWEISGPASYSASDVAEIFSEVLQQKVEARQIPREQWAATLQQVGFSENASANLIKMTEAVITGKATPENQLVRWETDLLQYVTDILQ